MQCYGFSKPHIKDMSSTGYNNFNINIISQTLFSILMVAVGLFNSYIFSPVPSPEADPMTGVEMYMGTMMAAAFLAKGEYIL